MLCIPHQRWGPAQCKLNCEEHAGSDKRFKYQPYSLSTYRKNSINKLRNKEHWKPWFLVEKRTRYLNVNRAAKNKLVLTKIGAYNPIPWWAAALNALIYKANQSTNSPFKSRNRIKACSPVRAS